jgi:hypothetical protein
VTFTRHTMTGSLELTDGTRLALDITDARAALEEARSPYSQIDLTTPIPESDVLERIDPRAGLRAQMTLRSDFGEGALASVFSAAFAGITNVETTSRAWVGAAHNSQSVERIDGVEVRRNLVPNPSFEASTTGWQATSGVLARSITGGTAGPASATLTPNHASVPAAAIQSVAMSVLPSTTYTLSGTITTPSELTGTLDANARKLRIQLSTASGTVFFNTEAGPTTGSGRVSVTFTTPANATGSASVILMNGALNTAANVVIFDAILLERAEGLRPYFDGSSGTSTRTTGALASDVTAVYGGKRAAAVSADYFTPWNSFGVRPPTIRNFNVGLRSFEADRSRGDFRLVFNTDEMLMQDYALVSQTSIAPTTSTVRGAVNLALSKIGAALSSDSLDATVQDIESLNWNPGVTAWDYVEPLVQKAGLRLYCTEQRVWQLVEPQKTVDGFLSLAAENNVTRGSDSISLDARPEDSYYDAVVVEYKWQDVNKVSQVAYDVAGEKERARKVYTVRYSDVPYPGPGAATAILRRSQGRGRVLNVDAISDYSTEPGLGLGISLPNSITQTGYVSAVDWQFPEGIMSVKSRGLVETPPDSWTLAPPELLWSTVADDTTWLNYPNISLGGGS